MPANRFAKWAGSYRPPLENAGLPGLKGLTLPKPQAFRGVEPGQPSNPTASERGLTGLKPAPAPAHPRPSYNPETPPARTPVPYPKPLEGCSNPSNPSPGAMGLTLAGSRTEEVRGFEAVQTRQTHQTPNLYDAEQEIAPCATTGPAGDTPEAWQTWMNRRLLVWMARELSRAETMGIVWSEAEDAWHRRHGAPSDSGRCAGCGRRMLDVPGMSLPDGAVVHIGDPAEFDCLIAYGVQWRQTASAALVSLLEEQAAVAEFAGGLARAAAERQAWTEMIGKPDGAEQ